MIRSRWGKLRRQLSTSLYTQLLRLLRPHWVWIVVMVMLASTLVFTEGLGLGGVLVLLGASANTKLSGQASYLLPVIQLVASWSLESKIAVAAGLLIGITTFRSGLQVLQQNVTARLRRTVELRLQIQVFEQYLQLPLDYLQREHSGSWTTIMTQFVQQTGGIVMSIANSISSVIVLVVFLGVALALSVPMTLLALVLIVVASSFMRPLLKQRIRRASRAAKQSVRMAQSLAQETLSGLKLIHLFNREEQTLSRMKQVLETFQQQTYLATMWSSLNKPIFTVLSTASLGIMMLASTVWLSGTPEMRLAQLAVFLAIVFRLMAPFGDLNQLTAQIAQNGPAVETVLEFIDPRDKPYMKNGTIRFERLRGGVTLENVVFHYKLEESPVLRNVTLSIPRGGFTAIVGVSGAGKTTLISLVTRLYDCTSGRIQVDGQDLRDLEISSWRRRVAVVSQDVFLFREDTLNNIRFARPEASDEEVYQAARLAQADKFIRALPQGYSTSLGERGVRLSGGQRQRIAMARALLSDADLLILDEATSELDSETERAIQRALAEYRQNRAVLAVAHRLSTIRDADNIYVLEDGQVVEQGRHEELMQRRGRYYQLAHAQGL